MVAKIWVAIQWALVLSGSAIALEAIPFQAAIEAAQAEMDEMEQPLLQSDEAGVATEADRAEPPATTVTEWIAQIEASEVQITAVRVEAIETGLQVVLETTGGAIAAPATSTIGNALIAINLSIACGCVLVH